MPDKKFELGNYVEVRERIAIFYELYPGGRLLTGEVRLSNEPDGVPRVLVQGLAYRTVDDPLPGIGWSWMPLPGKTSYTRDSELENTETSSWGRAIASLGILIDKSIASAQEVNNKSDDGSGTETPVPRSKPVAAAPEPYRETEELVGDFTGTGMVRLGTSDNYLLESRLHPEGRTVGFRMDFKDDANIPQVLVEGAAGEALFLASSGNPGTLRDSRLRVTGRLFHVKSNRQRNSWKRLHVTAWENADFKYPAANEEGLEEPPDDVDLIGAA